MTHVAKQGIFICAAKRTAFGAFGGTIARKTPTELATHVAKAALKAAGVGPDIVDHCVVGNVIQASNDAAYLARHVALKTGCPDHVNGNTVNRLCASGFESIAEAARLITMGECNVVLAGGSESMSSSPFVVRNVRFGTALGQSYNFEDSLWEGLGDRHIGMPMGVTAEKLGAQNKITRQDCDEFANRSQRLWALAQNAGYMKAEIAPMTIKTRKGTKTFDKDEHPRVTPVEKLAKLPPVFKKNGLVTAASASGVCDGASMLVVASESACAKHKMQPLARLVGWSIIGVDPTIMGIGPVPAIRMLFKATGLSFKDMEIVEINEAFAAQTVSCAKHLKKDGMDMNQLNVNGGAIAFGHPLGCSGSRIMTHITHEIRRRDGKYGVGSCCAGGGMGMAMIFEKV